MLQRLSAWSFRYAEHVSEETWGGLRFRFSGADAHRCWCLSGFQRTRHRSQRDHHQSGVLVQPQRRGRREGESHQRSGGSDPRRHAAGGADRTCQVTAATPTSHQLCPSSLLLQHHPSLFNSLQSEFALRCVCFVSQVFHRGGAADEDGLEGRSGRRASCEEESSQAADG